MLVSGYNNIILLPNCTMLYYVFSGPMSLREYVPEIKFNNKNNNNNNNVVIEDHSSDLLDMTCGVPQCAVLGPIIFIIYNDVCNVSDVVKCVLFADDTYIFKKEISLICNSL